ncbi:MAG: fucose isomerase, partial [Atopobiaceae bacterium]|nr:fucose isomerase [Atopobiaceae bacterium]
EGELLERFGIECVPVPLPELTRGVKAALAEDTGDGTSDVEKQLAWISEHFEKNCSDEQVRTIAAMAVTMRRMLQKYHCTAGCIQCWNELQHELHVMPCAANSILNEEGTPITCETDVHGAITSLMIEAADMGRKRSFFADWTIRHPDDPNGELLQHCGPWPCSVAASRPTITVPLAFDHNGALTAEAKHGEVTLARFDGDNGQYSMLLGTAEGIDGPKGMGTYLWVRVQNIKRLEAKIVEGPYIHHCAGIHDDVVPVLYEACKYLGITPDLYDPIEDDIKAYLRGE